eukprot:EG_transcript_7835
MSSDSDGPAADPPPPAKRRRLSGGEGEPLGPAATPPAAPAHGGPVVDDGQGPAIGPMTGYGAMPSRPPKAIKPHKLALLVRKAPLYDNCRLLSPAGATLCHCDRRKVEWYVSRGLAEVVEPGPPIVAKLTFEPAGSGRDGDEFYLSLKANRCVVCGAEAHLIRHSIVPTEYRRVFPLELKAHKSHDVVLLCVQCQMKMHAVYRKEKDRIAQLFGAPIRGSGLRRQKDRAVDRVANFARLLAQCSDQELLASSVYSCPETGTSCPTPGGPEDETALCPSEGAADGGRLSVGCDAPPADSSLASEGPRSEGDPPLGSVTDRLEAEGPAEEPGKRRKKGGKPHRLPPARIVEMLDFIAQHVQVEAVSRSDLLELQHLDPFSEDPAYQAHGEMVVKQFKTLQDFTAFVRGWRRAFCLGLRPQFLPEHWDVNYQEEVFAVKEPSQCRQPVSLLEFGLEDLPKRLQRQIPTIPDKS